MNIKTFLRKSVSVILCLSMLASFIVMGTFCASAEAVAGTYDFRVKWQCSNGGNSYKTGYSYDGDRTNNGNNWVGFTVFFRDVNGTGEESHVDKDLGDGSMKNKNSGEWVEWTDKGFPTQVFSHNDHGNALASGELKVKELQVKKHGAAASAYVTLWSGELRTKSNINIMEAWILMDGTTGKSGDDAEASGNAWTNKAPKPGSVAFTTVPSNTTVTAPKMNEANKTLQYEATVYDQYGVTWYQPPTYSLATAFDGVYVTATTGLVTITPDAHSADGTDTTINIDAVATSNKATTSIKIINAKYNYEFKDLSGATISQGSLKYGSVIPRPQNPTKPFEDACHYNFSDWVASDPSWNSVSGRIHMDTVLTPEFTPESHAFLHYYSDGNATCEEDGTKTATCACGKTDIVTDKGSKLGHSYEDFVSIEPGCESEGELTYRCVRPGCGYSYTEPIEATGHNYQYVTVEPTCVKQGYSGYVCERCNDSYGLVYTEALGHDWNDGEIISQPSCTENGERVVTCNRCNETETRVIEATGHNIKNWVLDSEPTCTENGMRYGTCKTCKQEIEEILPALGHTYGEWVKDCDPTCDTEGRSHRECSVCHHVDFDIVEPLGHNYELITVDPKTELGEGVEGCYYYHCDACNKYATCVVHEDGTKEAGETVSSKSEAIRETAKIPSVEFNTYNRVQSNYNYNKRGAALKIDSSNGPDEQSMRFCSSMLLPEGATIVDYGYIYSVVFTTMKKFVIGGDHVTQASLINGNHSTFVTDKGTVYTYNIVIPVNRSNWNTVFYARPYITYTYAGETFTVYDDMCSERSVNEIAERILASPLESDSTKAFFQSKIFG